MGPYDDIMDLPRPVSQRHPRMSAISRAAQFSPFAALTGYGGAIAESARQTEARVELDEDRKAALNEKLRLVTDLVGENPEISISYFVPDAKKAGGAYVTDTGRVKKIDTHGRLVVMVDGTEIPIEEIVEIEGEFFGAYVGFGEA
jgi:uncharacterized protein (UPF0248 family)